MLGIIPLNGCEGLLHALDQGEAATQALRAIVGRSWISRDSALLYLRSRPLF